MTFESIIGKIYYEDHGLEHDRSVVFIHGVGMDHRTFETQVSAMKDQFRVITMDLPGHSGSSDLEKHLPYSRTAGSVLLELLDFLQVRQAVLVGQSLGSFVAQYAAAEAPERVKGSVHIGGGSLYPRYTPLLHLLRPFIALAMRLYPSKMLIRLFAQHKALKAETQDYLKEVVSRNGKQIVFRLTAAMLREMTEGIPAQLSHPMLFACGDHDLKFVRNLSMRWHKNQPKSRFALIDDAHHIANQDNPQKFNRVLIAFLEEVFSS